MPKRKLVTPDTTERDWLRKNVPARTLTRWKKRKINRILKDIGEHTTRQHGSYEDASQREDRRAEPLSQAQESEDVTQREEQRVEPFTLAQESDEDASQREEQRGEPVTLAQENNDDTSQSQEQRAGPFTMVQDSVPQVDVHSHGLTEGQTVQQHCDSDTYSKTKQRNNSVVLLKDGSIFRVSHFIDMGDQCLYAIGNYGNCTVQKLARGSHIKTQLSYMSAVHFPTGFHKAINTTQVVRPCMYIQCPQSNPIVCQLLNTYYCK